MKAVWPPRPLADAESMTSLHGALLFLAAILAGVMNSIAGGGSFISFPALVFTGALPIPANATSTVALWPGAVASVGAYRKRLPKDGRLLAPLAGASVVGGVLGAVLLLHTPQATFMHLVSYLFAAATLLFAFGKRLFEGVGHFLKGTGPVSWPAVVGAALVQFVIAVYGGFFGGGIGILMLALLSAIQMDDIHSMNGVKSLLAVMINGAAVVTFIVARAVIWPQALLMVAGAVLGGYGGAHFAQKLSPGLVRGFIISVGACMTLYFFARY